MDPGKTPSCEQPPFHHTLRLNAGKPLKHYKALNALIRWYKRRDALCSQLVSP